MVKTIGELTALGLAAAFIVTGVPVRAEMVRFSTAKTAPPPTRMAAEVNAKAAYFKDGFRCAHDFASFPAADLPAFIFSSQVFSVTLLVRIMIRIRIIA